MLQVSDFLQDEQNTAVAAACANRLLFPDIKRPRRASAQQEEALLSLPHHITYVVLQAWPPHTASGDLISNTDLLRCMLDTLSAPLHVLAVSSCISDSELKIDRPLAEHHIEAIASIAPSLAPSLGEHDVLYWVLLGSMHSKLHKAQSLHACLSIWPIPDDSSPRQWDLLKVLEMD